MRTLVDLEANIKALALSIPGVEHFVHGDYDEFIGIEKNSSIRYPVVFMETPDSVIEDEREDVWNFRLFVLKKSRQKDAKKVREDHSLTHQLARKLLKRLEHESEESDLWSLGKSKHKLEPAWVGSDGNVGWVFFVDIEVEEECFPDNDLGIGTTVVPSAGGLILIHPDTGQRFAVTVDTDGSVITTLVNDLIGTTAIQLNDGSTLIINNADGSVATT